MSLCSADVISALPEVEDEEFVEWKVDGEVVRIQ